jgi:hypothetical protein
MPDEVSWKLPEINNRLFTNYLLEGIRGDAARVDGKVPILRLFEYISDKVPQHRTQHPMLKASSENFIVADLTHGSAGNDLFSDLTFIPQRNSLFSQGFIESLIEVDGALPLHMVLIPSGTFLMGSLENEPEREENEEPQHKVTVRPFMMGRYPVTQLNGERLPRCHKLSRESMLTHPDSRGTTALLIVFPGLMRKNFAID